MMEQTDTDHTLQDAQSHFDKSQWQNGLPGRLAQRHFTKLSQTTARHAADTTAAMQAVASTFDPLITAGHWRDYLKESGERGVLFLDAMRRRSEGARGRRPEAGSDF